MEGRTIMPAINKPTFTLIILVIIMFTPMPVWGTTSSSSNSIHMGMSANLALAVATSQPDDIIPVVAMFPEGSSPEEMTSVIQTSGLSSIIIRHAFHIIPIVSLYIRNEEVALLSENLLINGLTLDVKKQIVSNPVPVDDATLAANGDGYAHFTDQLGTQQMWDMGYNGTGVVVAVLDSGVDTNHP
ncbi:MAG: hypothetical protein ACTSWA_06675, partial [Candidatus Thorarchaeota archaeon]